MPTSTEPKRMGPVLYARGADGDQCRLAALIVLPESDSPPPLIPMDRAAVEPLRLGGAVGDVVWRYDFVLPAVADAYYVIGEDRFPVACDFDGDVRIAFLSCNGQEHGDADRELDERNVMWRRLAEQHAEQPFNLILQGGDQLYADDVLRCHPGIEDWFEKSPEDAGSVEFTDAMAAAAEEFLFTHYKALSEQPDVAWMSARVPALMMWDDHDIIDGWGSRDERVLDSPVGRGIFENARRMFCLYQLAGSDDHPPAICMDNDGNQYGFAVRFPGFSVVAPDLRTERRPTRVMGDSGWSNWERVLTDLAPPQRLFVMSSVPALGPRLSWVEALLHLWPRLQKYEDDLRDQWQSRAHREEWRRFLTSLEEAHLQTGIDVTLLSGEIHLATRGEMRLTDGTLLHQLVASGVAHPPPPTGYARALGTLARLGEDPLPGRPIRLRPLPGKRAIYTNERNYLVLTRRDGTWQASWELEETGTTPVMEL